jgi:hypothetical protein
VASQSYPVGPAIQPERAQGADAYQASQKGRARVRGRLEALGVIDVRGVPVERWHALPPQPDEPTQQQDHPGDSQRPAKER